MITKDFAQYELFKMLTKSSCKICLVFAVIFLCLCEGGRMIKREVDSGSAMRNYLHDQATNSSGPRKSRGFFPPGKLKFFYIYIFVYFPFLV